MAKQRLLASTPKIEKLLKQLLRSPIKNSLLTEAAFVPSRQLVKNTAIDTGNAKIKVCNISTSEIAKFTAVSILGAASVSEDALDVRFDGVAIAHGEPAVSGQGNWGIACEDIPVGEYGEVVLTGITPAYFSGTSGFVEPSASGLVAVKAGRAAIILPAAEDAPGIINLSGNSASSGHQFQVSDVSLINEDGSITPRVHVTAGVLNGVVYNATDVTLPTSDANYYVYALRGGIYVITHSFSSNLFPVLLIGEVQCVNSKLAITQRSFLDNIFVATHGTSSIYVGLDTFNVVVGANSIAVKLKYENNVLSCECTVRTKILVNATPMESEYLSMPKTDENALYDTNSLYAYCEKLIVDNNTKPNVGFIIGEIRPTDKEWVKDVLVYRYTSTEISVVSWSDCQHLFTFTRLFLNAEEDTANV